MILITGDLHGGHDFHKLLTPFFEDKDKFSREDYLIICGDFGLIWDDSNRRKYMLGWLNDQPWTTLWIDGNHENFDMLKKYPIEQWHGGKVHRIAENILHLCRGSIFDIGGMTFFAFGGAESTDRNFRRESISWWAEEMPSAEEMAVGRENLAAHGNKVDVILTHSLPSALQKKMYFGARFPVNPLTDFFDEVNDKVDFKYWFSGHYHHNMQISERHFLVYNDVLRVTENGVERVYYCKGDR